MPPADTTVADGVVQRRAPFADNPTVGERGTRTQQRILRAALDVFAEVGYHACRVERITSVSGCSRPAFYQYFSSKEDVFHQLAGQLAKAIETITDELEPVTADAAGREQLRAWVGRYGDLYDEYAPLFVAFSSAVGKDDAVGTGADLVARHLTTELAAKMPRTPAPLGRPKVVASVLLNAIARTNRFRQVLDTGSALGIVALGRDRIDDSLTNLIHRAMVGPVPGVNVARKVRRARRTAPIQVPTITLPDGKVHGAAGLATRTRLVDAATKAFARLGYHETRVDDIVEATGVSHGTFYRYFNNKDEVFRVLAIGAGQRVVEATEAIPDVATGELRDWLDEYADRYAVAAPIIRAWVEALLLDAELGALSTWAVEHLRIRLADKLARRSFGDADADGLVLMGVFDLGEYRPAKGGRVAPEVLDVIAAVIRRGFVGDAA